MKTDSAKMVGEDHGSAIIAVVVIECKAMDDPVQRSHDLCAGNSPDICAQVKTAGFRNIMPRRFAACDRQCIIKMFASRIQGTMFTITADAITGAMTL